MTFRPAIIHLGEFPAEDWVEYAGPETDFHRYATFCTSVQHAESTTELEAVGGQFKQDIAAKPLTEDEYVSSARVCFAERLVELRKKESF